MKEKERERERVKKNKKKRRTRKEGGGRKGRVSRPRGLGVIWAPRAGAES